MPGRTVGSIESSYFGLFSLCQIFMCVIPVVCVTNKEGGVVKQHN